MKKDAYYFPHFANARNDAKVIKLRRVLGLEGYAIYFMLLEILREQTEFKYPISGVEDLAYEWHTSKEKLLTVITNFELFEIDELNFFSPKLILYLQPYLEKSARASAAALLRWDKVKDSLQTDANALQMHNKNDANALQMQSKSNASKVKESKVKESKVKESKVKNKLHSFENSEYYDFEKLKADIGEDYQKYDLKYYYNSMLNYSQSKAAKYVNWLATCRAWINKDNGKNQAVLLKQQRDFSPSNEDTRKNPNRLLFPGQISKTKNT